MTQQDFSRRSTATELMDTDPVSFKEFDDYLRDLERNARLPSDHALAKARPSGFSSRGMDRYAAHGWFINDLHLTSCLISS